MNILTAEGWNTAIRTNWFGKTTFTASLDIQVSHDQTSGGKFYSLNAISEDVEDTEVVIIGQETGIRGEEIEEFDLLDKSFTHEGPVVRVTGELHLDRDLEQFTIVPLVFDENGEFLGSYRIIEQGVENESIVFQGGLAIFNIPGDRPKPAEVELMIVHPHI